MNRSEGSSRIPGMNSFKLNQIEFKVISYSGQNAIHSKFDGILIPPDDDMNLTLADGRLDVKLEEGQSNWH